MEPTIGRIVIYNTKTVLIDKIRERKFLGIKKKRIASDTKIVLIKGNLSKSGGEDDPQLVLTINGLPAVVHCNKETVRKVDPYKYKEILISTWCKNAPDKRPHYTYCDIYIHERDFDEFKDFTTKLYTLSESDEFSHIHEKFKSYFLDENFPKAKKLMRLFAHPSTNTSTLKSVLVVTKAFKDQVDIKDIRNTVKEILEKKIGKKLV